MDKLPDSEAFLRERARLPVELREEFDSLVQWYRFLALKHYQRPFVSYVVLADLVREGWRLVGSGEERPDQGNSRENTE